MRTTQTPSVDVASIIPERLTTVVKRESLDELNLSSRGHEPDCAKVLGLLRSRLENEAIRRGEGSSPSPIPETEAVELVLDQLQLAYPDWFSAGYDSEATGDINLRPQEFSEWFFQKKVTFETVPVEFGQPETTDRVVVPLVIHLADQLAEQREADAEARSERGKKHVRHAVYEAVVDEDLSEHEIDAAVAEAKQMLSKSDTQEL